MYDLSVYLCRCLFVCSCVCAAKYRQLYQLISCWPALMQVFEEPLAEQQTLKLDLTHIYIMAQNTRGEHGLWWRKCHNMCQHVCFCSNNLQLHKENLIIWQTAALISTRGVCVCGYTLENWVWQWERDWFQASGCRTLSAVKQQHFNWVMEYCTNVCSQTTGTFCCLCRAGGSTGCELKLNPNPEETK